MKKPKHKPKQKWELRNMTNLQKMEAFNHKVDGYNVAWKAWESYHKWDIKENYIRKDEFPSVAELVGILDAHRHCSISMQVRKVLDRIIKG